MQGLWLALIILGTIVCGQSNSDSSCSTTKFCLYNSELCNRDEDDCGSCLKPDPIEGTVILCYDTNTNGQCVDDTTDCRDNKFQAIGTETDKDSSPPVIAGTETNGDGDNSTETAASYRQTLFIIVGVSAGLGCLLMFAELHYKFKGSKEVEKPNVIDDDDSFFDIGEKPRLKIRVDKPVKGRREDRPAKRRDYQPPVPSRSKSAVKEKDEDCSKAARRDHQPSVPSRSRSAVKEKDEDCSKAARRDHQPSVPSRNTSEMNEDSSWAVPKSSFRSTLASGVSTIRPSDSISCVYERTLRNDNKNFNV